MKLTHLKLVGFRGFRQPLDIDVDDGFLIITGRNGSRKSTICDAIEFGLTGKLSRFEVSKSKEDGETIADYVWWRGEGEPTERLIELTFVTEDGEAIQIMRRPDTTPGEIDEKYARLFCQAVSDPRPFEELVRTMLLRDETIAAFSIDLAEADRFTAVERALGVTSRSTREELVAQAAALADTRVKQARSEYDLLRGRVILLTEDVARRRSEVVTTSALSAAEEILRLELRIPGLDVIDLEAAQRELANLRSASGEVEREYHQLTEALHHQKDLDRQNAEPKIVEARSFAGGVEAAIKEHQEELERLEKQVAVEAAHGQTSDAWAQLLAAGEHIGTIDGHCPLCALPISKSKFLAQIARIRSTINSDSEQYAAAVSRIKEVTKTLAVLRTQRDQATQLINGIARAASEANRRLAALNERLAKLTDINDVSPERVRDWLARRAELVTRLESALAVIITARRVEGLADLEDQLAAATRESELAASQLSKLTGVTDLVKSLSRTVREVTKEVTDERFAAASPVLEELYRRLRPHSEWRDVSYSVRGQLKKMLTFRVGDDLNPKFVFSSGQRRAAGLAFLLAVHLARNWCRLNTLVLDDPVQHIDDFRALHLVEVLSAIRKKGRQIICTVEDPALADLLVRRLQVQPLASGSRLELRSDPFAGSVVQSHRRVFALPQNVLLSA